MGLLKDPLRAHATLCYRMDLERTAYQAQASICFTWSPEIVENDRDYLHPEEHAFFDTIKVARRRRSYLLGRYAAKKAIIDLYPEVKPSELLIRQGIFTQPVVVHPKVPNIQVSISHSGPWGVALAFPEEHPMAIDLEQIAPRRLRVMHLCTTEAERELMTSLSLDRSQVFTLFWTAKEVLSKTLRTGQTTSFKLFEIDRVASMDHYFESRFNKFTQYKIFSYLLGDHWALSLALPRLTTLHFDWMQIREQLREVVAEAREEEDQ